MSVLLKTSHLTKRIMGAYSVNLVENINLSILQNEFVAITGPSGSGKSSLLYLLGLLDKPTSGNVSLAGQDTSVLTEKALAGLRLKNIGFVFQFHFLLAELSAIDNVMLPMKRLGRLTELEMRDQASALLSAFDLNDHMHKRPGQLSGGQRQRVAVARALANKPLLILADEPTGSLDSKSSQNVKQIFKNLVDTHTCSIVTVTHDEAFASAANREIKLLDGKIIV